MSTTKTSANQGQLLKTLTIKLFSELSAGNGKFDIN